MRPQTHPDIEAEVRFLSSRPNDYKQSVLSGSRLQHQLTPHELLPGHHEYSTSEPIKPGAATTAEIWFTEESAATKTMFVGKSINIVKNKTVIGIARVTRVVNSKLQKAL